MTQTAERQQEKPQPEQGKEERVFPYPEYFEGFLSEVGLAAQNRGVRPEGTRRIEELLRKEFGKGL